MRTSCIHLFTLSIAISLCFSVNAQTIQKGKVLLQNSGRKTLPGVQITAYGAQPADTDNDGIFSLNFGKARPGDMTPLKDAYKKGFELVNRHELDKWILSGEKEMFVVMCPAGALQTAREKYYDIGNSIYMKRYEQALKDIEHQKETNRLNEQDYTNKLEEAYNELNNSLNRLRDYSDIFSRINKDEFSELETHAFRLLDEGKLDEAIQFYENEKLMDKFQQQIRIKETAQQEVADMTASLRRYADICIFAGGKENLDKASQIYKSLALANPDDYQSQFDYGKFLRSIVKYKESIEWLQKALKCAGNKILIAETYSELGKIYATNRDYELSTAVMEKSAEIYRAEAKINPQYHVNVAYNLLFICLNLSTHGQHKKSMSILKSVDKYLALCNDKESLDYQITYSSYLHFRATSMLKIMDSIEPDTAGMNNYLIESIKQTEIIMRTDSANIINGYVERLFNVATYYNLIMKDHPNAEKYFLKSLEMCQHICNKNPFQGNVKLSMIYHGMAQLYNRTGRYEQAEIFYIKAYQLKEELVKANPNAFLPSFCNTLADLGSFNLEQHDYNKSFKYYSEGVMASEQLYKKDPSTNLNLLFSMYHLIGKLLEKKGDNDPITENNPESYYLKAEQLVSQHPEYASTNSYIYLLNTMMDYYEKTDSMKYRDYLEKYESTFSEQAFSNDIKTKLLYYGNMAAEADSAGKHVVTDVFYKLAYTAMSHAFVEKIKIDNELITETAWLAGNHFFERNDIEYAEKCYELYKAFDTKKLSEKSALFRLNVFAKLKYIYELTDNSEKLQLLKDDIDKIFDYLGKRVNKDYKKPYNLIIGGLRFDEGYSFSGLFFDRALSLMNIKNSESKDYLKEILVLYRKTAEYLNGHTNKSLITQFQELRTKLLGSLDNYASEGMDETAYIYYIIEPATLFYQNGDFAFALKCMDSYIKRPLIISEATTGKLVNNAPALKVLAVIYQGNKMNKECIDILNTLESIYISLTERTGKKYEKDLELAKAIIQEIKIKQEIIEKIKIKQEVNEKIK